MKKRELKKTALDTLLNTDIGMKNSFFLTKKHDKRFDFFGIAQYF